MELTKQMERKRKLLRMFDNENLDFPLQINGAKMRTAPNIGLKNED